MVFKSNYTLVICTTTRKYCADVSNASQEFCLSNTYLSTQSSSFKKGLNVVFEEHAIVQLQGKCLWLRNLYLNIDLPSLPLLNVGMFVTASFCEILLVLGCRSSSVSPAVPSQVLPGEGIGSQRIPWGASPRHPPHPAPVPGCSRTFRSCCHPLQLPLSASQADISPGFNQT